MNITVPTNLPSGDRRPIRVALPAVDPLHDSTRPPLPPAPLHIAEREARTALRQYETASIHDSEAMVSAATVLDTVLRGLLAALEAERAA